MTESILIASLKWIGITAIGGVVKSEAASGFKILKESFKKKFKLFFKDEQESESYYDKVFNEEPSNPKKPNRDLEDIYEELTGKEFKSEFIENFKAWASENQGTFQMVFSENKSEEKKFVIQNQTAHRDIVNVNGNVTIDNKKVN